MEPLPVFYRSLPVFYRPLSVFFRSLPLLLLEIRGIETPDEVSSRPPLVGTALRLTHGMFILTLALLLHHL
tara:strand:+ start:2373 stop:2585 length:213 start_codon:yes stop_codon:yes gene_type:complete